MLTRFRDLRLVTPPGVFALRFDAGLLLDAALPRLRGQVLDLCSGSGVLALAVAPFAPVVAVDVSRAAVAAIRAGALLNRRRVEVRRGDLFRPVGGRPFDVILVNPPYVPTPPGVWADRGVRAWEGGPLGRDVLDRICAEAPAHLRPGGELLLVQSAIADAGRTLTHLRRGGLGVDVIVDQEGPYGAIAGSRLAYLERRRLIADAAAPEHMVVIRASAPAA